MNVKKLFIFAFLAMVLGAVSHKLLAAEPDKKPSKNAGAPPLLDLGSEAKKQAVKDTKLENAQKSDLVTVTATDEKKVSDKAGKPVVKNPAWSYSGAYGVDHWGDLSQNYAACKTGKNQSPINLMDAKGVGTTNLPGFDVFYRDSYLKIIDTGHTVQVNYPLGSYIKINGQRYELLHFNFHTPSEHQINGFNYPMEMHLVHKDGFGNHVVIAIIFQEGEENELLQQIIGHLPKKPKKETIHRKLNLNPNQFFPQNKQFYKYSGSLTTPPCTEGVYWMVFKHPIQASAEQIQAMNEAMGENSRPVVPLNSRSLLKSWSDASQEGGQYEFYY